MVLLGESQRRDDEAIDLLRWSEDGTSLAAVSDRRHTVHVWERVPPGAVSTGAKGAVLDLMPTATYMPVAGVGALASVGMADMWGR